MAHEIYHNAKANLLEVKKAELRSNPTDKPMIRQTLNDVTDRLCRDIDYEAMRGNCTEKRAEQYKNWLTNYCCSLHP